MSNPHAARDHASWSASATERNWTCEGALALNEGVEDTTSVQADWGTVGHEIAEDCLFDAKKDASDYIGQTRKGKVHEIEVDEEMADVVMAYVGYCRKRVADYKAETGDNALIFIEQNLVLDAIDPPFDAGGTGDFIAIFEKWHLIEVVDLKTGRGTWVDATENKQARTYALGTMLKFTGYDVTHVKSTIIQPRMGDGKPKSETYHVSELMEWTIDLKARMLASKAAKDAYDRVLSGDMSVAEWSTTYLKPGHHCSKTFCKVRSTCPALQRQVEDQVGLWFTETDEPKLANAPAPSDPVELARRLDALDMIEGWCNAVREHAHQQAESGVQIPGYILVPKQGREKWNDAAAESIAQGVATAAGIPREKWLNDPKLRTPKQVRAVFEKAGKKDFIEKLLPLSSTPDAGTNLVRADKTTRAPIAAAVHNFFTVVG